MSTTNPHIETREELTPQRERILINLNQPRSVLSLAKALISDRSSPWYQPSIVLSKQTLDTIVVVLRDLEDLGLVRCIGRFVQASEVIEAIESDDDVPDLHPEKADGLVKLLTGKPALLDEGEFYYHTEAGLTLLAGPPALRVVGGLRNGKPLDEVPDKKTTATKMTKSSKRT